MSTKFDVGDLLAFDGTDWAEADNTAEATLMVGMVSAVDEPTPGTYDVKITTMGFVPLPAHGYTLGATYYLGVAGAVTTVPPSITGTFRQAVFKVLQDDKVLVLHQAAVQN